MKSAPAAYLSSSSHVDDIDVRGHGALVFLAICWITGGLAVSLPFVESLVVRALLLSTPVIVTLLLTLIDPARGFATWSFSLTFLVTQTGYQADIGPIRTSALELILLALLVLLVWSGRRQTKSGALGYRPPGHRLLVVCAAYFVVVFAISLIDHRNLATALPQFKGFLLYPFIAYVLAAGLRDARLLRLSLIFLVGWYMLVAGRGMIEFLQGERNSVSEELVRVGGDYATINTYGITVLAICLLVLGWLVDAKDWRVRLAGCLAAGWLFLGAVASVSRTVWVAAAIGVVALLLMRGSRKKYVIAFLVLGALLLLILPQEVSGRILQLSDTSAQKRLFYLISGLHAWQARWLTGWGWGSAFWYYPSQGLVPTGFMPWYHNDYVNLGVQTGVIGVGLYLAYWSRVLQAGNRWLKRHARSDMSGYVLGCQAALVGLLVSAGFEHVLWRTDIAGLVGLLLGLLVGSMRLGDAEMSAANLL